jgi:3-dehydroquinate synthase
MRKIEVTLPGGCSEISVARGLLSGLGAHLGAAKLNPPFLLVSQPRILRHVTPPRLGRLEVVTIPDGERAKTLGTVRRLLDTMVAAGLSRDATVLALGGGVVGDTAGFAASIYLRGIPLVQIPTTLLAQVDSSVGGKTGVNHAAGKNLIGTFYQPRLVLVDPDLLGSLPERQYRSGLYEALKYGVIRDPAIFSAFERERESILTRDPEALETLIFQCLRIKADVVAADEREGDLRRILNFGHSIGHGIEAALAYRKLLHGEAVGYGMIGAARLAARMGRLSPEVAARIESAVRSIGPLPDPGPVPTRDIVAAMRHDKKVRSGMLHFVLPRRIGRVSMESDVPLALVRQVVRGLW